jgi:hypothetical protein
MGTERYRIMDRLARQGGLSLTQSLVPHEVAESGPYGEP